MPLLNRIIGATLDLCFNRKAQERLGRFILHRARGEDNDDASTNGEYAFLNRLSRRKTAYPTIFDVGANKGEWVRQAYEKFGSQGRYYAFEPVATTYDHLQKQLAAIPGAQIYAAHLALGESNATVEMDVSGELAGSNSFYQRTGVNVKSERVELVSVMRGIEFCSIHKIDHITLLKIDTEGHEMAVLSGFTEMLVSRAIDFVQFEYGGTWIDARILLKDAFSFFSVKGYRLGRLMPDYVEWYPSYRQELEDFRYSNWIAARAGLES